MVLWRLRYKLRLRDIAEMFLERGFVFSHEAVRDGEARCAPWLAAQLRARRRGTAGSNWHADETSIKVNGRWRYRYRAIVRAISSKRCSASGGTWMRRSSSSTKRSLLPGRRRTG